MSKHTTFGAAVAAATPFAAPCEEEEVEIEEFLLPETSHPMEEIEMLSAACDEISFRLTELLEKLKK